MTLMDTAQLLGNVGEFIGAIVIVITLIYLALQIRQNTNARHGQSRQAVLSAARAEIFALIEHRELHLNLIRTGLSPEEHIKLGAWLSVVTRSREYAWLQYRNGAIDAIQWRTESLILQAVLSARNSRTWWVSVGRQIFPAEFVNFVDGLIRDQPPADELVLFQGNWTNIARQPVAD